MIETRPLLVISHPLSSTALPIHVPIQVKGTDDVTESIIRACVASRSSMRGTFRFLRWVPRARRECFNRRENLYAQGDSARNGRHVISTSLSFWKRNNQIVRKRFWRFELGRKLQMFSESLPEMELGDNQERFRVLEDLFGFSSVDGAVRRRFDCCGVFSKKSVRRWVGEISFSTPEKS